MSTRTKGAPVEARAASAVNRKRKFVGFRIDIETRSSVSIKTSGVYPYVESPDFDVLIIGHSPIWRYEGGAERLGAVRVLDLNDPAKVAEFKRVLLDKRFQKHAYNANFERIALSKWVGLPNGTYIDPANWHCSAVRSNVSGIFGTLDEVARAVRSPIKKDTEGRRLIRLFSIPDKQSDRHPGLPAGMFHDTQGECWCGNNHEADFVKYGDYCKTDVMAEAMVAAATPDIPLEVQAEYEADQRINDRGVRHFAALSRAAVAQVEVEKNRLMHELTVLTGIENPNSNPQFMAWLVEQGYPMVSLDKAHRIDALTDPFIPEIVADALRMKGSASLSSVTKHKAALNTRCADGRIRGSLQFYGAHTGREAGRGIQPQNLPRAQASKADMMRLLQFTAGQDAPEIAKGTVRSSLVPAKGHVFVVPDYNAIEARCLGWACGEDWVEAEFDTANGGQGKIYEATAATMFGVDKATLVEDLRRCGKCGVCAACATRSKGKVSNLALGYGGGAGALVTMGAAEAGIDVGNYTELHAEWVALGRPGGKFHEWERDRHDYPELLRIRDLYREASPMTARFWKLCAKAWDVSATTGKGVRFGNNQVLTMLRDGKHNRLVLPSGRSIWYRFAAAHATKDRPDHIDRRTFIGKSMGVGHVRTDTHGGKLCENITQAIARDVLFDLIMKIEDKTAAGWPARIVLHVHDEVVLEVPEAHADQVLADTLGLMAVPPDWAPGLAVQGAGGIMQRYGK